MNVKKFKVITLTALVGAATVYSVVQEVSIRRDIKRLDNLMARHRELIDAPVGLEYYKRHQEMLSDPEVIEANRAIDDFLSTHPEFDL